MRGWFPTHYLVTLAFWCLLRLILVCSNLTARTMRKKRNDPRKHPRKYAYWEVANPSVQVLSYARIYTQTCFLASSSTDRCGYSVAIAQRGTPGYDNRFIAGLWRPAPTISACS